VSPPWAAPPPSCPHLIKQAERVSDPTPGHACHPFHTLSHPLADWKSAFCWLDRLRVGAGSIWFRRRLQNPANPCRSWCRSVAHGGCCSSNPYRDMSDKHPSRDVILRTVIRVGTKAIPLRLPTGRAPFARGHQWAPEGKRRAVQLCHYGGLREGAALIRVVELDRSN